MRLRFVLWSIATVYISMLTSCLTPKILQISSRLSLLGHQKSAPSQPITWIWQAQISSAALSRFFTKVVIIQSYSHHTFLRFPHLTVIPMYSMYSLKWLWRMESTGRKDLLPENKIHYLNNRRLIGSYVDNWMTVLLVKMPVIGSWSLVERFSESCYCKWIIIQFFLLLVSWKKKYEVQHMLCTTVTNKDQ